MSTPPPDLLHDLFADAFARYLTVRPGGLQMPHGPLVPSLRARLLICRPARTLYENHQPRCRSLDGIQSIASARNASRNTANAENRTCATCILRGHCTPQIFLELLHDRVPYRLLLAYTSARNFILFVSRLRKHGQPVENSDVLISVLDRGRWGEVRFSTPHTQSPVDSSRTVE
jgi:hypothetical protein